ncbi:MAG: hypothetical protein QXG00_00030 [Candidatus Woesearchaeota archaeon]
MDRSLNYIRFGIMCVIGIIGMITFEHSVFHNISVLIFIISLFVLVVIHLTPESNTIGDR